MRKIDLLLFGILAVLERLIIIAAAELFLLECHLGIEDFYRLARSPPLSPEG